MHDFFTTEPLLTIFLFDPAFSLNATKETFICTKTFLIFKHDRKIFSCNTYK